MEKIYKCPKCGEKENLHYNYDYNQQHRPIKDVLCNDCGEIFEGNMSVELFVTEANLTKPGFVERRMKQGKANNDKLWNEIYEEYSTEQYPPFGGPFTDTLSFIDWLKQYYIVPEKI